MDGNRKTVSMKLWELDEKISRPRRYIGAPGQEQHWRGIHDSGGCVGLGCQQFHGLSFSGDALRNKSVVIPAAWVAFLEQSMRQGWEIFGV